MNLPEFAVRRPITVFMLFGAVVLFGLLALMRLPVDLMPSFEFPMVSVVTLYPGAASEDIEASVTELIEDGVSTISGVEHVDSVSQNGISAVMVQFAWGTDLTEASSDIRDQLDMLANMLPHDIEPPMLIKTSSTNIPILVMGATAEESFDGLRHIMKTKVADPLKAVSGVAEVTVMGGPEREIQVLIDPKRLEATGVSLEQITRTLAAENLDMPAGNVKLGWSEYTVRVPARLKEPADLEGIVVGQHADRLVHLRDVADVKDTFAEQRMKVRADKIPGVIFFVSKQSGANSVTVAHAALAKLAEIEKDLPPDVEIFTFFDTSDFIGKALRNLRQALLFGAIGVIFVVLFFLRRVRSTIVIGLTIPATLMAGLFVMYVAGYTINMVSLMSIAIALGLVVDAAVVVLENVTRHVESGERVREASVFGPSEIGQALGASTLTTVVVFVPMLFITNITGVLFKQMALVVIVAISMSLFTALTLTPALTSTFMRRSFDGRGDARRRNRFFESGERMFARLEERYSRILQSALAHRKRTVLVALAIFVGSMALLGLVKTEFFPQPDSGEIEMTVELAPGTKLDRTMDVIAELEDFVENEVPEREYIWGYAGESESGWGVVAGEREGVHVGRVGVQLVDKEFRTRTSDEIGNLLRERARGIPAIVRVNVRTGSIRDAVREVPGAVDVELDIGDPRPEFHIMVDREKAAALGLNTYTIAAALRTHVFGVEATKIRERGDEWKVVVRAPEEDRATVDDILALPIPAMTGRMVRLSSVASVELGVGPTSIKHRDQQRIIRVDGRILDRPLGEVAADIRTELAKLEIPPSVNVDYGGDVEQQQESFADLGLLLLLSIALVYMVMASQFESFVDPFIVMFSIPFAFVGVVWAFLISNTTLSMTSFLGVIMLMGIVVNNAIVLVDYTNIMRKRGMDLEEAVLTSGRRRLRPVLMTAFTTIFGMLPLAVMRYAGSEMWRPLGVAMVGGLLVSTLVTLVLVPTLYTIFEGKARRKARWAR